MKTALLLSGGMDSIAILYWQKPDLAITVDYGQRPARGEIAASRAACEQTNTPHRVVRADCSELGIGTMSETLDTESQVTPYPSRPEWWPYRNQLVVTLAASIAMPIGINRLIIGTVKNDRCHGDGTSEFIAAMNETLGLQEGHLLLDAPSIHLDTVQLIRESGVPSTLLGWAHSCHIAPVACGECRGCLKQQDVLVQIS